MQQRLDAYHQRQLHKILGIKYPTRISNEKLYKVRGEKPISYTMREQRWELFGHILRRDRNIPAFKAMELYFTYIEANGFRGKPRTTLPKVLNEDLNAFNHKDPIKAEHNYCHRLKLNTEEDLEELRALAEDRKGWKKLTRAIILKTGEAATPNGEEAELQ